MFKDTKMTSFLILHQAGNEKVVTRKDKSSGSWVLKIIFFDAIRVGYVFTAMGRPSEGK